MPVSHIAVLSFTREERRYLLRTYCVLSTQLGAYSFMNESGGQKESAYLGAEIEELAGLSEVISLYSKAQIVVS